MLNKILTAMLFAAVFVGCESKVEGLNDRERNSVQAEDASEYEKQLALTKQANKVKCQDARMDMVDAEADGDVNMIRQVKARLMKYCEPEE